MRASDRIAVAEARLAQLQRARNTPAKKATIIAKVRLLLLFFVLLAIIGYYC